MDMKSAFYETKAVPIRTVEYLNGKDAAFVGAFLSVKDDKIPLYYQYCQTRQPNDSQNTGEIGYGTNFRVEGGMLICDVCIHQYSMFAHHFQGMIDNYTIHMTQDSNNLIMKPVRLLVYNKTFKAERDKEILDGANGVDACVEFSDDEDTQCEQESLF